MDSRKNVELHNAVNMCLSLDHISYIHDLEVSYKNGRLKDTITRERNIALYAELVEKHKSAIFKRNPKPIGDILENGKDKFIAFETLKQCEILIKLLCVSGIEHKSGLRGI